MKKIILGITGSIASYKGVEIVRLLKKRGYGVNVVMTPDSTNFISPLIFEIVSENKVIIDQFKDSDNYKVEHVKMAREADLMVVAPASLNTIGKFASGIADNFLALLFFAYTGKVLIAPAMNTAMYLHPVNRKNIDYLKSIGVDFITPSEGSLACGEEGVGRLAEPEEIVDIIESRLEKNIYNGKRILISGGGTREKIDDFRFITNPSSGKTGVEFARIARNFGAKTTLVSGKNNLKIPSEIDYIEIESADDMYRELKKKIKEADILIMSAAVADFKPADYQKGKIKKTDFSLNLKLEKNPDILRELSLNKRKGQIFVGFSAEYGLEKKEALKKLKDKKLDIIVLNSIKEKNLGFGSDDNRTILLFKDGDIIDTGVISKRELAKLILEKIYEKWIQKR
jgi:phosphopantothenoylcysteine decarboxylase/phosphopantothenate--cysteine ligase